MRQKSVHPESPSERIVKNIRRATRKRHSSEEKIRIVLNGLRGESSIAELCRREGIAESLYYAWSKEFLEAGKRRLAGDTARAATNGRMTTTTCSTATSTSAASGGRTPRHQIAAGSGRSLPASRNTRIIAVIRRRARTRWRISRRH